MLGEAEIELLKAGCSFLLSGFFAIYMSSHNMDGVRLRNAMKVVVNITTRIVGFDNTEMEKH